MGVFFDPPRAKNTLQPALQTAIADALMASQPATLAAARAEAATRAAAIPGVSAAYLPLLEDAIRDALVQPQSVDLLTAHTDAAARSAAATRQIPDEGSFHAWRLVGAVVIFGAIIGAAIGTDAAGLPDSSKALYGFAASIFGVVVGLLGGEKTSSS
jgi:uncharacterized membrane protein